MPGTRARCAGPGRLTGGGLRPHEQQDRGLAQRVVRHGVRRRAERFLGDPGGDQGAGEPIGDVTPELVRGLRGPAQRRDVGEVGEGRPAPDAPGLAQQCGGGSGIGGGDLTGAVAQHADPPQVEPVIGEAQPVTAVVGGQTARPRSEVGAQPGDVAVHGGARGFRRVVRPEGVDHLVDGDGAALGQREQRQHGAALGSAHVDRPSVDAQPQRPEHVDPDGLTSTRHQHPPPLLVRSMPRCQRRARGVPADRSSVPGVGPPGPTPLALRSTP